MPDVYTPGTEVAWNSQAHGVWRLKQGIVEAHIPAGESAYEALRRLKICVPRSRIRIGSDVSSHDRYLVVVPDSKGRPWVYAPRAAAVALVVK